jgi:hypothetical protein
MQYTLDFRGRNKQIDAYKEKKDQAIRDTLWYNKDVHKGYLDEQASLNTDLRVMSNHINQALLDKAKYEEYLRQNPHLKEDCFQNTKDCIASAWKWAFPTKSNNTIQYDSAKKNNGGKKSRKSQNSKKSMKSKKSKKSKRSHTTIRSRR